MSELVTVPKVSGTAECEKHRTISLISHTSKALSLEIIKIRIQHYLGPEIADDGLTNCLVLVLYQGKEQRMQ